MTEQARLLTEFLGECPIPYTVDKRTMWFCDKCGHTHTTLDFNDWRVIGRLIEKMNLMISFKPRKNGRWICFFETNGGLFEGDTPQEAIINAVISYLETKG